MILRWKKFHGLNPSGDSKLWSDHFAMATSVYFVGMVHGRNLPYGVLFVHLWYMNVLSEKTLNYLWVHAILQAFEADLFLRFWPKSPFLVIDSSWTKHSFNIIECVLGSPTIEVQNFMENPKKNSVFVHEDFEKRLLKKTTLKLKRFFWHITKICRVQMIPEFWLDEVAVLGWLLKTRLSF